MPNLADKLEQWGKEIKLHLIKERTIPDDLENELVQMANKMISAAPHIRPYLKGV